MSLTPTWVLVSLLAPPLAALAAWLATRDREIPPGLLVALNAAMPGAGLAAARRPLLEVAAGVVFATVSLLTVGRVEDLGYWLPIMVVGGAWGVLHTPFNPLAGPAPGTGRHPSAPAPDSAAPPVAEAATTPRLARASGDRGGAPEVEEETGYAVSLRCTECGAGLEVPALQHMARCPFCSSDHLVAGHDQTLHLALPERITDETALREAVLDHYRYRTYVQLYQRHVAPLERQELGAGPHGHLSSRPEVNAAAVAAERAVSQRADAFRRRLAAKLRLGTRTHLLAPYRHGMGTLYQAAFGRSTRDQEKELRFAIANVEAATLASASVDLPPMGKLSYLRALVPAAQYGEGARALPLDRGEEALDRAFGALDQKRLVRDLTVIRQANAFLREVSAVVWRPWWVVEAVGPRLHESLLVDSAAGSVAGLAPPLDPAALTGLPAEALDPGAGLRFVPMQCPTCGFEFAFDVNAVLHFCHNCHRVCAVDGSRKVEVDYDHEPLTAAPPGSDLVPFWRFDLRLRTRDRTLVTDLLHLKDGVDGTLDQVGEGRPTAQDAFYVPAFRCVNSRLMVRAFSQLLAHTSSQPRRLVAGRLPLEEHARPWPAGLAEAEARTLAPLYLALVFDRRDLARARVDQVASWLLESTLEARGRLAYLRVPRAHTETFRAYVGRFRARALADAGAGASAASPSSGRPPAPG